MTICAAVVSSTSVSANDAQNWTEIVELIDAGQADLDFKVTTGFPNNIDLITYVPALVTEAAPVEVNLKGNVKKAGWAGHVEVELTEDETPPLSEVSAFSDDFATTDRDTKLSGFYSMRYEFNSKLPFRPYAGAGLGLVATSNETESGGVIAGRATAGFDLTVGEGAAVFAEYAYVKSGGVRLGAVSENGGSILDNEHSLKLGFRRTF